MDLVKFKTSWSLWALVFLCLIILVSHSLYVLKTCQYPHEDEHFYLGTAMRFYDILKRPSLNAPSRIMALTETRQPLYPVLIAIFLLIFGTASVYKTILWLNAIFYLLIVISIYFLGKEFLSKKASFLASFIFAFYGFPLFYLHFVYSEIATTAFVALSLLFLAKSKNFFIRKNTLLFSLFFALGSLVRWVVPIFVGGPLVASFVSGIIGQFGNKRKKIKTFLFNFLIFIAVGILIPLLAYYLPKFNYFSGYISRNIQNAPRWVSELSHLSAGLQNTFSIRSMMFYFNILSQQTIYFFVLFVAGLLLSSVFFKKYSFFLLGFLVPYFIFTFGSVLKADRFIVPIYPMMALVSAIPLDCLKNKKLEIIVVIFILSFGLLNFLGASWGIGPMGKQGLKDIVLPELIRHPRRIYLTPIVWPPRENYSNADLFINTIENDFGLRSRPPVILFTFSYYPFENAAGSIILYEKREGFIFQSLRNLGKDDYEILFGQIKNSDYILVKDEKPIDGYRSGHDPDELYMFGVFNQALQSSEKVIPGSFVMIQEISIPLDKTYLKIYKKKREVMSEEWENLAAKLAQIDPNSTMAIWTALAELKEK